MRRPLVALIGLIATSAAFTGCQKEKITTYQVPKEAPEPAKMPADHNHAGVAAGAAPGSVAPASSGGGTMANTPVATASGGALTWKGPAGWQEKPAGGMRRGTFTIPGDGGATAELAITAFPGDVGGDVANVNRWRQQINLPPLSPDEANASIEWREHNGLKIGVVDLVGAGASATRVLGAIVPHAGATWFFKLTGPDALVAKQKETFLAFLQTVQPAAK